eukprot:TRINITY_DN55448_c0_g1_i1.p1 TRINITY_DN55448_c0_g1~~TRINITY_DN55448_c0_g1_i1.p1  ORF type:complete len:337 (-),score=57.22 TRINITY_DN55448_c0_g1_i1:142-1152(-)
MAAVAFAAIRRSFAAIPTSPGARRTISLASLVHSQAARNPSGLALSAPQQNVKWNYQELSERSVEVAGMLSKLGYQQGDVLVTDLPNSAENLVLQVACSHIGTAVATVKDKKALADLSSAVTVRGAITHQAEGATEVLQTAELPVPTVALEHLDGTLGLFQGSSLAPEAVVADSSTPLGYWSSTKPLTCGEALSTMGADACNQLGLTAADRVLVSITLCHAFGIGSAVGAAFTAGSAVVLPGASGIRGCGSPTQRAEVTLKVLASEQCTILFADVHTLKALPPPAGADLSSLRGGACKIGSGATFLHDVKEAKLGPDGELRPLEYAGIPLVAVGKK